MSRLKNLSWLILNQGLLFIAPLIVLPFLTRTIELESFGILVFCISICNFAYVITDYGFDLYITKIIAENNGKYKTINSYISSVVIVKTIAVLFIFIIILSISAFDIWHYDDRLLMSVFFIILFQGFLSPWLFLGIERMECITISQLAGRVFYVLLVFLFVDKSTSVVDILDFYLLSIFLSFIICQYFIFTLGYRYTMPQLSKVVGVIKGGFAYFISRISVTLYTSLNLIILGAFDAKNAAYYSVAEQGYKSGQITSTVISQLLYPIMARDQNYKVFKRYVFAGFVSIILLTSSVSVYSGQIVELIFGEGFDESGYLLSLFMLLLPLNYLSVMIGYPLLVSINRNDVANQSVKWASIMCVSGLSILYMLECLEPVYIIANVLIVEIFVIFYRAIFLLRNIDIFRQKME